MLNGRIRPRDLFFQRENGDEQYSEKVEAQEYLEADSLLVLNAFCFSDFL